MFFPLLCLVLSQAVRRNSFGSELEYAKLLWQKGESRAINLLQASLTPHKEDHRACRCAC